MLFEIALRFRNLRNVFFIHAHDAKSLSDALFKIATSIGPSILASRHSRPYLPGIWSGLRPEEKVRELKSWLGNEDNKGSIFIVDDLDGLGSDDAILSVLPKEPRTILYSTRDPSIMMDLQRSGTLLRLTQMCDTDLVLLMRDILRHEPTNLLGNVADEDLQAVAQTLHGHALAACRAVFYMVQEMDTGPEGRPIEEFIELIRGVNWQARREFINYKPRFATHSVMECFEVSLQRLRRRREATEMFLNMIGFLSGCLGNTELSPDFNVFLALERPWLSELTDDLPDNESFAASSKDRRRYLLGLENVAIVLGGSETTPAHLHPAWVECVQQREEHQGRIRWLRQVYLLCEASIAKGQHVDEITPFKDNCDHIAARFGIPLSELAPSESAQHWLHKERANRESPEVPVGSLVENNASKDARQKAKSLLDDCHSFAASISEDDITSGPEEMFHQNRLRVTSLLQRAKGFDETCPSWMEDHQTAQVYEEIFDILISISSHFRSRNPMLGQSLQKIKEKLFGRS